MNDIEGASTTEEVAFWRARCGKLTEAAIAKEAELENRIRSLAGEVERLKARADGYGSAFGDAVTTMEARAESAERDLAAALERGVADLTRMKPEVAKQIARLERIRKFPGYEDRAKAQMLAWAQGRPYHEPVNEECCPDFSCCHPKLFTTDSAARWAQYREKYGGSAPVAILLAKEGRE